MTALLALTGCDWVPPEYERHWVALTRLFSGEEEGVPAGSSPAPAPSPGSPEYESARARIAKANSELLREVYSVVFIKEPKDRAEFGNLVDSMNQGASVEGMYNGFTHGADYKRVEAGAAGASPEAIQAFGEELAWLELELPEPIEFDGSATGAAIKPSGADGVTVVEYGKAAPSGVPKPEHRVLAERYSKQFVGASIYTLKRVLGDEALRVTTLKKEYPEKLALWYSRWVVRMAARGVDYGMALRNQADEAFHYKWALTASDDRIRWEVLNRVHRVLNEANKRRQ